LLEGVEDTLLRDGEEEEVAEDEVVVEESAEKADRVIRSKDSYASSPEGNRGRAFEWLLNDKSSPVIISS
jgi:hypothetical protein